MKYVLILVLLEDGLGATPKHPQRAKTIEVLILVLLEDGLGGFAAPKNGSTSWCLNPCFVGGWSWRKDNLSETKIVISLNPCFVGGWSWRSTIMISNHKTTMS